MHHKHLSVIVMTSLAIATANADDLTQLPSMTVDADLRGIDLSEIAASVTILDENEIQDRGASHFSDVLLQLPNVNFSGEGSLPRHIQIRGMGERDEYTGAPNASVGFAIDGIDFSGIGMPASLFDVQQVEVLRGPQGTRYGANALAGLINIKSNAPSAQRETLLEVTGGQDNLREFGLMTTGAFSEDSDRALYRLSLFRHLSDGFRKNDFLDRDNTNNRDELYLRGQLSFQLTDTSQLDLTLLHANIDNGYDAWSLNNNRRTLTDEPGDDKQRSSAIAAKFTLSGFQAFDLISTSTYADSSLKYSYDGDWVHPGFYPTPFVYNFSNNKQRETFSQEFRFVSKPEQRIFNQSTDWLTGIYFSNLRERNRTAEEFVDDFTGGDLFTDSGSTRFNSNNIAVFGQLDHHLDDATVVSGGLRVEHNRQRFSSSASERFSPSNNMIGGHISISHQLTEQHNAYAAISRGYKAGGFNTGLPANASNEFIKYDKETAWNYELGLRSSFLERRVNTAVTLFYMDRRKPQFDGYTFDPTGETFSYVFFTENLDKAKNYGIEAEADWQVTRDWKLFGSLGLLKTKVSGQPVNSEFTISSREQAHAPSYQYNVGALYRNVSGYFARVDVTGVDAFYYDNVHNFRSSRYTLTNARLGYESNQWEIYLWGRNIFDRKYATRGFFFTNEPSYSEPAQGYEKIAPGRQFGVTARLRF